MPTRTDAPDDTAVDEGEAARMLGLARETVARMRRHGTGPKHFRIGCRTIRYLPAEVRQWRAALRHRKAERP